MKSLWKVCGVWISQRNAFSLIEKWHFNKSVKMPVFRSHFADHGVCPVRLSEELHAQESGADSLVIRKFVSFNLIEPRDSLYVSKVMWTWTRDWWLSIRSPRRTSWASPGRWPGAWTTSARRRSENDFTEDFTDLISVMIEMKTSDFYFSVNPKDCTYSDSLIGRGKWKLF